MRVSQDASKAHFRVAVLSAHISGGLAEQQALSRSVRICLLPGYFQHRKQHIDKLPVLQDCSAPAHARAVAADTQFARPITHVRLDLGWHAVLCVFGCTLSHFAWRAQERAFVAKQVQPITVRPRLKGPTYHPTKPGTYQGYSKRASAGPRFARPCQQRVEDVTSAVVQPARICNTPQVCQSLCYQQQASKLHTQLFPNAGKHNRLQSRLSDGDGLAWCQCRYCCISDRRMHHTAHATS